MQPGSAVGPASGGIHVAPTLAPLPESRALFHIQWWRTVAGYIVEVVEPLAMIMVIVLASALRQRSSHQSLLPGHWRGIAGTSSLADDRCQRADTCSAGGCGRCHRGRLTHAGLPTGYARVVAGRRRAHLPSRACAWLCAYRDAGDRHIAVHERTRRAGCSDDLVPVWHRAHADAVRVRDCHSVAGGVDRAESDSWRVAATGRGFRYRDGYGSVGRLSVCARWAA